MLSKMGLDEDTPDNERDPFGSESKCCEQNNVAPKLIANVSDLEAIAVSDNADVRALKGWRRKIFGDLALDIKHGKLAIAVDGGEAITVPRDQTVLKAAE